MFTEAIEELRATPVRICSWRLHHVGRMNEGPYKGLYQKMPVNEDFPDILVDVSKFGISGSDYYLDNYILGASSFESLFKERLLFSRPLLRRSHALRLAKADAFLRRNGLFLFIRSGWRHRKVQLLAKSEFSQREGVDAAERIFADARPDIAAPPHSTGAAADIEVWSLRDGVPLRVEAIIHGRRILGLYDLELLNIETSGGIENESPVAEALRNRRILYHVLCTEGIALEKDELWVEHPGEYWHFGSGDALSAFLKKNRKADCGEVHPQSESFNIATTRS